MSRPRSMISEDWVKEYEKILISRKIHKVGEKIGETEYIISIVQDPIEKKKKVMECVGAISSLIDCIPLFPEYEKVIEGWRKELVTIISMLHGNEKIIKKEKIKTVVIRRGLRYITVPNEDGFSKIMEKINALMRKINIFTTEKGLRITLPMERKIGASAILEEENIKLVDV